MNDKIIPLIQKVLDLTNSSLLQWESYSTSLIALNPVQKDFFSDVTTSPSAGSGSNTVTRDSSKSYVCEWQTGYIALFAYRPAKSFSNYVELILQPSYTSPSHVLASTQSDFIEISSQLKRLYNVVDSLCSGASQIDSFVEDILNN